MIRPELSEAVQLLLAAGFGWLAQRTRALPAVRDELEASRRSQGERLGLLEDRVARLEGQLGITPPAPPVGKEAPK